MHQSIALVFLLGSIIPACSSDTATDQATGGSCTAPPANPFVASLCSCTDVRVAGYLSTSSDPANPTAGGVGANGGLFLEGYARTSGSLKVAGAQPLGFYGYLQTGGDLAANGPVEMVKTGFDAGYLSVDGSASVAGDISLLGYAKIGGDLTQPAGSKTPVVLDVGGARHVASVEVAPPCACDPGQVLDIAGMIAGARAQNDNAAIGLAMGALSDVIGVRELILPDGEFYVDSIGGIGVLEVHVTGRSALFVGGDVNSTGLLNVKIDPGGELDLYIGGDLRSIGAGVLGPLDRPGVSRVYVAGSGDITLVGATGFAGNVYAPHAAIRGIGATVVRGSLFGRSIEIPGYLEVGYDARVQGTDCEPILL
jgi:hypothetical protein